MSKSILSIARSLVAKYKAKRVKAVVTQYLNTSESMMLIAMTTGIEFYSRSANVIIDKTEENPEVALKFIEAAEAVVKHYGPALAAEFEQFKIHCNAIEANARVEAEVNELSIAIAALKSDTQ